MCYPVGGFLIMAGTSWAIRKGCSTFSPEKQPSMSSVHLNSHQPICPLNKQREQVLREGQSAFQQAVCTTQGCFWVGFPPNTNSQADFCTGLVIQTDQGNLWHDRCVWCTFHLLELTRCTRPGKMSWKKPKWQFQAEPRKVGDATECELGLIVFLRTKQLNWSWLFHFFSWMKWSWSQV